MANIKSIGGNPIVLGTAGIEDGAVTDAKLSARGAAITAGAAEGITGGGPTSTAAWVERACPGTDGPASIESIHGRTLRWNQLMNNGNFASSTGWVGDDATVSVADGVLSMSPSASGLERIGVRTSNASAGAQVAGHKYISMFDIKVNAASNISALLYGVSYLGVSTSVAADTWTTLAGIATLETPVSGYTARIYCRVASGTLDTGYVAQVRNAHVHDLTAMFGAGNEPSTVAEFEAMFPESYYPYDAGSLLSVNMEGVETVGRNLLDSAQVSTSLSNVVVTHLPGGFKISSTVAAKNRDGHIALASLGLVAGETYTVSAYATVVSGKAKLSVRTESGVIKSASTTQSASGNATFTFTYDPTIHYWLSFFCTFDTEEIGNVTYTTVMLSRGSDATTYEPYWTAQRTIPAATYFPNGMRSAGSVYDELTETQAVTRVGSVDLGTLTWSKVGSYYATSAALTNVLTPANGGVVADATCDTYEVMASNAVSGGAAGGIGIRPNGMLYASDSGASPTGTLHYALATPTTTPIDPPLNLTYKAAAGGTERVTHTDATAAPTLAITYGSTADGIRDRALACIAPVENGAASTNYGVGAYLMHGGQLCRVTTAIATGEAISIGTNVTTTTVMAEVIALTQ